MIKVKQILVGPMPTNCYIVENNGRCLIIDPGFDAEKIIKNIDEMRLKPLAILLTHGHFDHITDVGSIRNHYNIKVYAGKDEKNLLLDPSLNLSSKWGRLPVDILADTFLEDEDFTITDGEEEVFLINAILTPGHTKGGVCYYFKEDKILFSGDTLFRASIGRTDFPTSSYDEILDSLNNKLMKLDDDVVVYSGHGYKTSIGFERNNNPYVRR